MHLVKIQEDQVSTACLRHDPRRLPCVHMPRVMGKVRHSEDANSAWIALPLMDPLDGKLLFIQPSDQEFATQEAIFSFGGRLLSFICLRALFTHTPLEILCRRRADSCPIGVRIPVAWLQGQSCEQRLCMLNSLCEWPFLRFQQCSPLLKIWPDVIHKYGKSRPTNRSSSCELSKRCERVCQPHMPAVTPHSCTFQRYCDVRVKMLSLFVFYICIICVKIVPKPVVVQYCRADCWT